MESTPLTSLEEWYRSLCDGDWEHGLGITIASLDNPGWSVTINLADTELEEVPFSEVSHNEVGQNYEDEQNWWICQKVGTDFRGSGGPKQLGMILHIFAEWVRSVAEQSAA